MTQREFYIFTDWQNTQRRKDQKIKNFPAAYVGKFYRNLAGDIDGAVGSNYYSRIANDVEIPSSDLQKYLLATSNFSNRIQNNSNHYVMRDKLNNASLTQNPIVGSLLRELDIGKKDLASKLIK